MMSPSCGTNCSPADAVNPDCAIAAAAVEPATSAASHHLRNVIGHSQVLPSIACAWPSSASRARGVCARSRRGGFEPASPRARPSRMYEMTQDNVDEVAEIIAEAAPLPLGDAAFALWRQMSRLDRLEGRPTDEQVQEYRAMTQEQWHDRYRYEREHAYEGPMFHYLKRSHPRAGDTDIK